MFSCKFGKISTKTFLQNISGQLLLKLALNERRGKGTKSLRCNQIPYQIKLNLKFRINGVPRLLIIPSFTTLPSLIQHSLFINFGGFCQSPLLFQTPRLLIHVHSRQWQSHKICLMYMFFKKQRRTPLLLLYLKCLSTSLRLCLYP